jgi:signal peptidase II
MKIGKYFLVALVIVLIDQTSKVLVHTYMVEGQTINVLPADGFARFGFKLHYLLNPGMAFGIRWESEFGKLALTLFRLVAMVGIGYYLFKMVHKAHNGFLICMGLILGGAVGNVIDSVFYGVFFNNALEGSPTPWFHGQVIDMLYFPLFQFEWPSWLPILGGKDFLFFSPVFNIADSSIFIGVVLILVFQKRFFAEYDKKTNPEDQTLSDTSDPSLQEQPTPPTILE